MEILNLLDKDKYTGEQIVINYAALCEKWGEIDIIGNTAVQIKYVDVGKAFINGASVTYFVLTILFFVLGIIIGKILFPQLAKMYRSNNETMVDIATLRTQEAVLNKKTKQKEWF